MIFRVLADDDVQSLARIDASATIVFDQNEPIDTPPIFNTVSHSDENNNISGMFD